jgi:hypothetical protein
MKEAVVFVPGFDAHCQNYYLDNFLAPGLLAQLEDINIRLDPEDVKIPGQTGKRFYCTGHDYEKTIDIYEVYWNDLVERLSSNDAKQKFTNGLYLIYFWFVKAWNILKISPIFFLQASIIFFLLLAWYYGVVVIILSALSEQTTLHSIDFLRDFLRAITVWASTGWGWQAWILISALLAFLPISINTLIDTIYFFVRYIQSESNRGKPPVRSLLRSRVKQAVDNVIHEEDYDHVTILAYSLGTLISTDFLADYVNPSGTTFQYITWGSTLKSSAAIAPWMALEIEKCLDNPHVQDWNDFYSNQDWLCSNVPAPNGSNHPKLSCKHVSFRVSFIKQISGESHLEYFFDPKVLRHLVRG